MEVRRVSKLPPAVTESEFRAIETDNVAKIKQYFEPFKHELHSFLNEASSVGDIQNVRRRWRRTTEQTAFTDESFKVVPRHWYTYNRGGRSEAQFNIGLFPGYLRVGLGFEFSGGQFGKPDWVQLEYRCFRDVIARRQRAFADFVHKEQLRIEWTPEGQSEPRHTLTADETLRWLSRRRPPKVPDWVFVSRLLDRRQDAHILEDPHLLANTIEAVFEGLLPYWKETQADANRPA